MKINQPLISIVTPIFNGSKYIEELIASVLVQDYPSIEHIIIDDGSNDNGATVEILKRYPHVRWWSRENRGAYATMNEGLLAATGQIVTIINSDDLYEDSHAISDIVSWWQRHPHFDGVCGSYSCIDAYGNSTIRRVYLPHWPRWLSYYINTTPHFSLFVDRQKLINETVMFDTTLPYAADSDWCVQMYRKHFKIGFTKRIVSKFRIHESQRTNDNKGVSILRDLETIRRRYDLNSLVSRLILQMLQAVIFCGACLEDMRAGEIRMALRRLLHRK